MKRISERELHEMYDESLNDCFDKVEIAGLVYETAFALSVVDPTAYRCGFADWLDANDIIEDEEGYLIDDGEPAIGDAIDADREDETSEDTARMIEETRGDE